MKKQLKLALLAFTVSAACAANAANYKGEGNFKEMAAPAPCPIGLTLHDGFYVGGQVGYDSYRAHETISNAFVGGDNTLNSTGFAGGLFAGYGNYWDNFYYLGAEVYVNDSNASQHESATLSTGTKHGSKFDVTSSWGISLLPGLKVNETSLLYVRLGYTDVNARGRDEYTPAGGTETRYSKNGYQGGFQYGVGLETAFAPNWSVRGEYSHSNPASFHAGSTKFDPSNNQFMLGLLYHFA